MPSSPDILKHLKQAAEDRGGLMKMGGAPILEDYRAMFGGTGVSYASAPIGAQTYSAGALVSR